VGLEGAIAVPEQQGNRVVLEVRRRQVELAIAVEIACK
jgi:hypothetical protein